MLALRDYQESGADFLYGTNTGMMLAPVGAGKTATALVAMQAALDDGVVKRWLVVAPKRVCQHVWAQEAKLWTPSLKIKIAVGVPQERANAFKGSQVTVINYDNLQWLCDTHPELLTGNSFAGQVPFDGLILDELTKLKNASGERFKALFRHIDQFKVRWGLTGSFTDNGLEDTFGQCKIINRKLLGRTKGAFMQQYFVLIDPATWRYVARPGALQQVMTRIKPAVFLLENHEYKDTLPPLHIVPVPAPLPAAVSDAYAIMKRDYVWNGIAAQNGGVWTQKLQQLAGGFIYDDGDAVVLDMHKLDVLEDILEENQHSHTIVAYWYQEELAQLKAKFPHAKTLDDKNVVEDWNAGKVELLLLHPQSAGHGLNLQYGGCKMVFLSLPWSFELYGQTIGRLHRSGQKHDVWVYVIEAPGTIDGDIMAALKSKRDFSVKATEVLK